MKRRFAKAYLEITNVCNRSCAFCPGTKRTPGFLQEAEFQTLLSRLQGWTDFLYFHLMGEPLLHPQLEKYLALAGQAGFRVILTTNGTLLPKVQKTLLLASALHKVNISLHSFEANEGGSFDDYLRGCIDFANRAAGEKLVCFRLWNLDGRQAGLNSKNEEILAALHETFPGPWTENAGGFCLTKGVFLEWGERFDWPNTEKEDYGEQCFCYGLRDQIGVLCDGTVVPCCLDANGTLAIGNLLSQPLSEILDSPAAKEIYDGFSARHAARELCRHCGYARRFSAKKK